jgi:hypothetical protein
VIPRGCDDWSLFGSAECKKLLQRAP